MSQALHHLDRWKRIAADAFHSGGRCLKRGVLEWHLAGNCQSPVYRELLGAESPGGVLAADASRTRGPQHRIELWVRCRRCSSCAKARAAMWRARASAEIAARSGRTWFGTLTLSPHEHFLALGRASLRLSGQGISFDRLTDHEKFVERHKEISRHLTLWLKRVRKQSQASLRFLLVAERHKSGLPHYHVLVHEQDGEVRHRTLSGAWRLGFSKFNLVAQGEETRAAAYVSKYISKAATCRIRASRAYGDNPASAIGGSPRDANRDTSKLLGDRQRALTYEERHRKQWPIGTVLHEPSSIRWRKQTERRPWERPDPPGREPAYSTTATVGRQEPQPVPTGSQAATAAVRPRSPPDSSASGYPDTWWRCFAAPARDPP